MTINIIQQTHVHRQSVDVTYVYLTYKDKVWLIKTNKQTK